MKLTDIINRIQIRNEVWTQVWKIAGNQIWNELNSKSYNQIQNQINIDYYYHVWDQVYDEVKINNDQVRIINDPVFFGKNLT
jgi:hypothetical protein